MTKQWLSGLVRGIKCILIIVSGVEQCSLQGSRVLVVGVSKCHEIKRRLLLERKVMSNLDGILKSRDITLLTQIHRVFTYGYESWTIKKAQCQRIDAFEL